MKNPAMAGKEASAKAAHLIACASSRPLGRDEAIDLAEAALDGGCEERAVFFVRSAALRHPEDAALWQWTGLLERALDEHQAAITSFRKAAALAPADPLLAHSIARTSMEAGLPSLHLFERARQLAPGDGEVLLGSVAARCAHGQYEEAVAELNHVLAQNPGWCAGHAAAMQLRWMLGNRHDFERSVETALARRPRDSALWHLLLTKLATAGCFEKVVDAAARAKVALGEQLFILANEAIALSELRRDAEADQLFRRIERVPDVSIAVSRLRHLLRSGQPDVAARMAEPFVAERHGNMVLPYLSLAWRLLGDSRWEWLEAPDLTIRAFDLKPHLPPLGKLADHLRRLHLVAAEPFDQSLRCGTQTDGNLFQRVEPIIRAVRSAATEAVRDFMASLPPQDLAHPFLRLPRDRSLRFSGAWSIRLTQSGFHANHNHPNGWISSALYVHLPDPHAADLPNAGSIIFGQPEAELAIDLPAFRTIAPQPGMLVLFPSTMWHGTLPFAAGERMTIAFDVAPPAP